MKKHYLIFILILFYFSSLTAQSFEWQKCYGGSYSETLGSIRQTHDGGFIIAGASSSHNGDVTENNGNADYWIVKIDSVGVIEWEKSFGGSGTEWTTSIEQTFDRGYIICGTTQSNDGDVTGHHAGIDDWWIVKLDSAGSMQWQKTLGGSGEDEPMCIKQTMDKGYIIAGETESNDGDISSNNGIGDYWIVKLDSAGSIQWQKTLGGSNEDVARSILQTSDGGYIVAGESMGGGPNVIGNHGLSDYWIVKLDGYGIIQWQKSYGGSDYDAAYSFKQTSDNGYIIAGYTRSNNGDVTGCHGSTAYDCWIVKIDSIGVLQWQKALGGSNYDVAHDVEQTNDGSYIIIGTTYSYDGDITMNHGNYDCWIIKLNSSGNILWQQTFGGSNYEEGLSIVQTNDGSTIIAGQTISTDGDIIGNHGSYDIWIAKLSKDVGVENYLANEKICYSPNPTSGIINIQIPQQFGQTKTLEIFDYIGKLQVIKTDNFSDVDMSFLTSGLYFIVLTNNGNERQTIKIIKE